MTGLSHTANRVISRLLKRNSLQMVEAWVGIEQGAIFIISKIWVQDYVALSSTDAVH